MRCASRRASAGTPSGGHAPHELARLVEGVEGDVEMVMTLAPRPEYGLVLPLIRVTEDCARTFGGPNQIGVRSDRDIGVVDGDDARVVQDRGRR